MAQPLASVSNLYSPSSRGNETMGADVNFSFQCVETRLGTLTTIRKGTFLRVKACKRSSRSAEVFNISSVV